MCIVILDTDSRNCNCALRCEQEIAAHNSTIFGYGAVRSTGPGSPDWTVRVAAPGWDERDIGAAGPQVNILNLMLLVYYLLDWSTLF